MADAFGENPDDGGQRKGIGLTAVLIIGGVAVLALLYMFSRNGGSSESAAAGTPIAGQAAYPGPMSTVDTTGLQEQLSNLVAQISAEQAAGGPPSGQIPTPMPFPISWGDLPPVNVNGNQRVRQIRPKVSPRG